MSDSALPRWRDRRFLVLLALGFSAGVPLPLTAFTLRQWLSESGISLGAIGLTALIGLAYSLKFLWAPVLDHAKAPLFRALGRRRGWLATIQPALALAILALGLTNPTADATMTVAVAVAVAFLSASQDIVVDAYRIEVLEERDQGYGLACYVWGYRGALLAAGGGALAMAELGGWSFAFAMCAAMIGVGFAATLAAPEPELPQPMALPQREPLRERFGFLVGRIWLLPVYLIFLPHRVLRPLIAHAFSGGRLGLAVGMPLLNFAEKKHWFVILAFIALFKLGEALAGIMTAPFYRELGFSRLEVASVSSVFGLFATLLGALAGGWLVARIGTGRALVLTGVTQMLSNLMYVALAHAGHDIRWLFAQVGVENFTDGLADAAFVTYLSALTSRSFTATQYALLSSLAAVPLRTLGASSGWFAEALGWPAFFLMTTAAALPAMGIMVWLLRHLPPPPPKESP